MALFFALVLMSHPSFYWGVASAAFQVEGAPDASDWREWTESPGRIKDSSTAKQATNFWNRYDEDFKLTEELGANAYRLSIAWERIEPEKGKWNLEAIAHYEKIVTALRARHLEPFVTLHHFVLPKWLAAEGGLLAPDFPKYFERYGMLVVDRLSAAPFSVRYWMTFNEPGVLARGGYLVGDWPPGEKDQTAKALLAMKNMAEAHLLLVRACDASHPTLQWGIAHHIRDFQPKSSANPVAWLASQLVDWIFNRQFLNSLDGKIFFWAPGVWPLRKKVDLGERKYALDFLGINYYGRSLVSFSLKPPFIEAEEGPGQKTDIGWEIYPAGLKNVLKHNYARYHLPILISENGVADRDDRFRCQFIKDHVAAMQAAQAEGVEVLGYLHWSLTDNFEWAEGLHQRFGLVAIDYENGQARKPRPSYECYRDVISSSR